MDNLMSSSLTGKVAEKSLDSKVGKETCCPDMGFKIRIICFLGLFVFGLFMVFIAGLGLKNASDDPDYSIMRFIVPYIAGFAMALGGTFFLAGFKEQIKQMFDKERRIPTAVIIGSFTLILIFAFATENATICILLMVLQYSGIGWYVSSYIPGFKKMCCCCCKYFKKGAASASGV